MSSSSSAEPEDFTDAGYEAIVRFVAKHWPLTTFTDADAPGRRCLWRHDVDFSIHRAKRMAEIESAHGIRATYFVLVHADFYNLLEPQVSSILHDIANAGHEIALHFDPTCHNIHSNDKLQSCLMQDRQVLENVSGQNITSFTYHLPDVVTEANMNVRSIAGMLNASHPRFQETYTYCSDSNGYWRFNPLWEVLQSNPERLYVLTHPSLWTPSFMAPRQRIERCISGRTRHQRMLYDGILARFGRENRRAFGDDLSTLAGRDADVCYAFEGLMMDGHYLAALYILVNATARKKMSNEDSVIAEQLARVCADGLGLDKPNDDAVLEAIRSALAILVR